MPESRSSCWDGKSGSLPGPSSNRTMVLCLWAGAAGKTTFVAAIACAAVDVDGPLVEPMAEPCWLRPVSTRA